MSSLEYEQVDGGSDGSLALVALAATPREPGVSDEATIMPTDIAALAQSGIMEQGTPFLSGWVSPDGHYYRVRQLCGHDELGLMITGRKNGYLILVQLGWVHLAMSGSPDLDHDRRLTKGQIATLLRLCMVCEGTSFADKIRNGIATSG